MTATSTIDRQTAWDFPPEIIDQVQTPCYLISEDAVRRNCQLLDTVQRRTGAKILLALKAFALPALFPLIGRYLHGVCASGPVEARLGRETFGREVHTYAPAYTERQLNEVIRYSDHILFNSIRQWQTHRHQVETAPRYITMGLRVNPGHAEVTTDLYNPCLPGSRFGIGPEDLKGVDLTGISGLHFHALCEQNADVLVRVLHHFEQRFAALVDQMQWINFGGGHHITRADYDIDLLSETIIDFRGRYNDIPVYLEPGEAVVLNSGVFVTSVVDTIYNGMDVAILDCSAETHLPDVLAMPYRPYVLGSGQQGELLHPYRLAGISCLAGDIVGDYSFNSPLEPGQKLVLTDMALYSFVKNTTFNGVELPSIYLCSRDSDAPKLVKRFGYHDYLNRIA
ncbi:MAG: carboxynorspermidine decarboxylase [Desulfopila sp.]